MKAYRTKSTNITWSPVLVLLAIVAAHFAGTIHRLPLPDTLILRATGGAMLLASLALITASMFTLITSHTTILPTRKSTHLVTTGPFGYSRNPIYAGYILGLLALALLTASGWFVFFGLMAAASTHILSVRREELHLLATFGADYEYYCRHVRRWV